MLLLWWPFQLNTVLASFSIATLFLRHQLFCCEIEILSDTRTACVTKNMKIYDRQDRHALAIPYIALKSSIWNVLVCAKRGLGCWEPFSLGIPLQGVCDLYGNMIWNVWLEKQSRSSFEAFDLSIRRENTNSEQDNRWYWGRYCPWTMLYCSNEKLVKTCVSQNGNQK